MQIIVPVKFFICIFFAFTTTLLSAQRKVEFREGYYITKDGIRVNGFLAYKPNARRIIHYARDKNSEPKRIKAPSLKGFVIDNDSFAIISNFTVEGVYRDLIRVRKSDIARVLEIGPVILYQCHFIEVVGYSPYGNGDMQEETIIPVYILRRKDSSLLQSVPERQSEFNKVMARYFHEDEDLQKEISDGKYANRTIRDLVKRFNGKLR